MHHHSERLEYGAKIVLYVIAALLPIWFLPLPIGVEFGREITFSVLIIAAAMLWVLSVLTSGEIRYQHSPLLYAGAILLAVFGASVFFSSAPYVSALAAEPLAEKFSTLILGLLLVLVAGAVFKGREDIGKAVMLILLTGTIAGAVSAAQFLFDIPVYRYLRLESAGSDFNVVGTVNGLALFYGALFMAGLGSLVGGISYRLLIVPLAVFLFNLLLINFLTAWIALLGSAIFLFGLTFKDAHARGGKFDWRHAVSALTVAAAVVLILLRTPIWSGINLPLEVSPSFRATLGVTAGVFKEGTKNILLGSGPGMFNLDWGRYKDPSINQTQFWGVRFNQGSSWFSTLIPTVGILGVLAWLLFLGTALFLALKSVLLAKRTTTSPWALGLFLGTVWLILSAFLYPANLTLVLFLFLAIGLLSAELGQEDAAGRGFWSIRERTIGFEAPWTVFIASLAAIFILSLSIAALYGLAGRARAAYALSQGTVEFNRGQLDQSLAHFERAARLESANFRYGLALAQARTEKVRNIIQRASRGENVQQEFQSAVSLAVQDAQAAVARHPQDAILWRAQGALYEVIIPFIQGAEQFAFSAYVKAAELEPQNPAIYVDWGRAGLVFADRLQLVAGQAAGQERSQIEQARRAALEEVEKILTKAIDVKADHAPAHFLLAQTALRLGNADGAIRSTENARASAPFDIGVAFQLGLLYYQNNDLNRARAEFERAITLNENYSNARYFLGLIYDRQGERARAIEEFEKVAVFNPDNQEVRKILENLREGKPALDEIAPPGVPPEQRSEAPIR